MHISCLVMISSSSRSDIRNVCCTLKQGRFSKITNDTKQQQNKPEKTAHISRRHHWETNAEIPYWWRVTIQIWVVLLIGWRKLPTRHDQNQNQKHYQNLGNDALSVCNSCARFSDVIFRETSRTVAKCKLCFLKKRKTDKKTGTLVLKQDSNAIQHLLYFALNCAINLSP